jgi:hypothetical protein
LIDRGAFSLSADLAAMAAFAAVFLILGSRFFAKIQV